MILDRLIFSSSWLVATCPDDEWGHCERYEHTLWMMHLVAHFTRPKRIVELGVRAGYSAWAMLAAAPGASYVGYDNYSEGEDPEKLARWAGGLLSSYDARVVQQDTQAGDFLLAEADLYHIDASHEYLHERCDIERCVAAGTPRSVFMIHDFMADPVRRAAIDSAQSRKLVVCELPDLKNGIVLLFHRRVPEWASRIGGRLVDVPCVVRGEGTGDGAAGDHVPVLSAQDARP